MILTGNEPERWHRRTEDGRLVHALGDPRQDGIPRRQWSADDRRYVAHLEACEARYDPARVEPAENDLPITGLLLDMVAAREAEATKLRHLVVGIRQAQDAGKTDAEIAAMLRPWPNRTAKEENGG